MAINFEPIFDGMQNGPEKITENFDKVNNGLLWGQSQQFLNLDGLNSNYTSYKIRNNGSEMHIGMYVTGDGRGSCYLPTSIAKKMGNTEIVGRTDNNSFGFMHINIDTGKCTFYKPDGSGMYIQALVPLIEH